MSSTCPASWEALSLASTTQVVAPGEPIYGTHATYDRGLTALVYDAELVHQRRLRAMYAEASSAAGGLATTGAATYTEIWRDIPVRTSRDCSGKWEIVICGGDITAEVSLYGAVGLGGGSSILVAAIAGGALTAINASGAGAITSDTTYYLRLRVLRTAGAGAAVDLTDIWIEETDG